MFRTIQSSQVEAYPRASLVIEKAGTILSQCDILLARGKHYAIIDLAGRIKVDATATADCCDAVMPVRHPWQIEIQEAESHQRGIERLENRHWQRQAERDIFLAND